MPKKVLIASESAYRRTLLSEMLSSHNKIIIVDIARNGQEAINILETKELDVLILDIEYKNNEWVTPFNLIIKRFHIPTIILTDIDPKNIDSLEIPLILNSYDYIVKPMGVWKDVLPTIRDLLISKVILAHIPDRSKVNSKVELLNKDIFIHQSQKLRIKPEVQFNETKESFLSNREVSITINDCKEEIKLRSLINKESGKIGFCYIGGLFVLMFGIIGIIYPLLNLPINLPLWIALILIPLSIFLWFYGYRLRNKTNEIEEKLELLLTKY